MVVRVRAIPDDEGNRLRCSVRHGQNAIEVKRAPVILASAQAFPPPKIGVIARTSDDYARELIHDFNLHGFSMLKPPWGPWPEGQVLGRPASGARGARHEPPEGPRPSLHPVEPLAPAQGGDGSESCPLHQRGMAAGHSPKGGHRPPVPPDVDAQPGPRAEGHEGVHRAAYAAAAPPSRRAQGDEIGPIQLVPQGGTEWFPKGRLGRIPAEYPREFGPTYYFQTLNLYHRRLSGAVYRTKHSTNWLEFLKEERSKYPSDEPVYRIQDGLSTPWMPAVRPWARHHEVVLVSAATHASWRNPVETHAKGVEALALPGTEFISVADVGKALDRAAEYRNDERSERGKRSWDIVRRDRRHHSRGAGMASCDESPTSPAAAPLAAPLGTIRGACDAARPNPGIGRDHHPDRGGSGVAGVCPHRIPGATPGGSSSSGRADSQRLPTAASRN